MINEKDKRKTLRCPGLNLADYVFERIYLPGTKNESLNDTLAIDMPNHVASPKNVTLTLRRLRNARS